jgi:hypothetical protein
MNENLAEETSLLLISINADLDQHLVKLQAQLHPDEFNALRLSFARVMAGLLDIVNPIYAEHPTLKPSPMGGSYIISESKLGSQSPVQGGA